MRWDAEQERILRDHGNKGAEWCAREIEREFGIARSPAPVQRHASRIGAPLLRYEICPMCGRATRSMSRKGVCRACNAERLREEQERFDSKIRAYVTKGGDDDAYRENRRKYDALRKRNERYCREHGLPSFGEWNSERKCAHSVDLSEKMSNPRSEA